MIEKGINQKKVLREIWKSGGRYGVKEIAKYTNLTIKQIHNALMSLKGRGLVYTERNITRMPNGLPPLITISIKPNMKRIKKIKEVIKENGK